LKILLYQFCTTFGGAFGGFFSLKSFLGAGFGLRFLYQFCTTFGGFLPFFPDSMAIELVIYI